MHSRLQKSAILLAFIIGAWAVGIGKASAAELDCSVGCPLTSFGPSGVLWATSEFQSTGTGVIDSFVRVSTNNPIEQGMNTDYRPLNLGNENSSPQHTHDIQGSNLTVMTFHNEKVYDAA